MGTMTKKDFIAIASVIQRSRRDYSSEEFVKPDYVLNHVAEEIAHVCARSNKLFDFNRFLVACGARR